ncbi:hypothetical protein ASPWEDRAFT_304899 [Aspergillus wentii DTO 134E9]|uniref:Uncharacterized protein n=1 Tax=Aspergillus wentii DTO 134E9 TaxID=1073089 RepID=A0A1L9R411_ASPWE|nr:uncharacterized protein ASPWEDRAFT_304899 [Aspergillus wentii DTO 134E9]OJJ29627.1 hypothetical protein ASPWEDRAFT_304899 [Aspergillus wentii DTO 134E9]
MLWSASASRLKTENSTLFRATCKILPRGAESQSHRAIADRARLPNRWGRRLSSIRIAVCTSVTVLMFLQTYVRTLSEPRENLWCWLSRGETCCRCLKKGRFYCIWDDSVSSTVSISVM